MKKKSLLLIEDDLPKQNQILDALSGDCEIQVANSINSAIVFIDENNFEGVLLDMSLPTFNEGNALRSGGRQQDLGGRHILSYMWEMEIQTSVLVITQLPGFKDETGKETRLAELDSRLKADFPGLYCGFTSFQHSKDTWIQDLRKFVGNL